MGWCQYLEVCPVSVSVTKARRKPCAACFCDENVQKFARDERGAVTIFATFMIFMMLMICGIAVDLMQNEVMRTRVQNTLDRAILAAADLDQPLRADDVVDDYFAKAGMSDFLEDVSITPGADLPTTNYRIVTAEARTRTPTSYMSMTGVDWLPVYTSGTAEEVIEKTEISLVLDISGSMRFEGRIGNMRLAANDFITAVLDGVAVNTTSVNLVPYAGQTNPGRLVFDRAGGVPFGETTINADGDPEPYGFTYTFTPEPAEGEEPAEDPEEVEIYVPYNTVSSCLEIGSDDFDNIDLPSGGYAQTPYFMNWSIDWPTMDWGWCPQNDTTIQYAQNNIDTLKEYINRIRLHDGTGTHYGMKYGVALLNPSSNDTFRALNAEGLIPDAFTDRPGAFEDEDTRKFIVLMTDGQITEQVRPKNPTYYKNPDDELAGRGGDREQISSKGTNVSSFYKMCDEAKENGILIYTIAFEAPSAAVDQMRNCASAPAFFYDVEGVEIRTAFKSIARQINQLRLTQ
ncbi:TadE/TadG family type IV pilus assembly protein [Roseobacter ponti]